ncbi:MAG TPA: T9SS type A sorting domain-containing protein [Chitinophagales bacterium]|nr:T9SS type A sorting domain-containing protein [Chitinophagales bacterium]
MKNMLLFILCIGFISASAQTVPFSLDLQEVNAPGLPAVHSYAKAQAGDKWLIVAGRVDGLHSLFPNQAFSFTEQNNNIFVIDTSTWNVWQSSLYYVPYQIRQSLSATNTEFYQRGNYLYVIGGFGFDSLNSVKKTFSTLTALDVDGLISEIVSGGNDLAPYMRQISDTMFAVAGGKIESIGSKVYLAGGQDFSGLYTKLNAGLYTQHYMNSITGFDLNDDGINISVNNFVMNIDTVNFHRRDLNCAPWISSSNEEGFAVYGGVFQYDHDTPYQNPIYVTQNGITVDASFEQKTSQYQCPVIPLYDSAANDMYSVFIAGMSLYYFDSVTQALKEDTMVPFIKDISTLIHHANGTTDEVILPVQFPQLGGANAEFFQNTSLQHYENGVMKLRTFTQPVLLGYIFGGMTSIAGNDGVTSPSNKCYRVILEPDFGSGISPVSSKKNIRFYPNPSEDATQLIINIPCAELKEIKIIDALNHVVAMLHSQISSGSETRIRINTKNFPAGIYSVIVQTQFQSFTSRLAIVR